MNQQNKLLRSERNIHRLIYMASFLISALGMLLILKARGFYPFKDTTLFVMDMQDQYVEFYASLRYLFGGDNSLFYSWSRSMGGNYIGLFAYYIASPLAFLTLLFPVEQMPLAITVLSVLKIGLCGLSFSVYAVYLWEYRSIPSAKTADIACQWVQLSVIPLSVSYALMSYNITYLCCLMWLDGVIFLPMILLGVEKLLDGKKGLHYTLSLAGLFLCNYYTGYMVGIFTALYLLFRGLTQLDKTAVKHSFQTFFKIVARFAFCTLLALGLAAPILLPVIRDLSAGRLSTTNMLPDSPYNFQPFPALLGQLSNGAYISLDNSGLPAIYCGYLILGAGLWFFLSRRISIKEKLGALILLGIFALSFYYVYPDLIWHGFKRPVCFPYRYAFLCSFLLLYMALRAFICLPWRKLPTLWQRRPIFEILLVILMLETAIDMGINGRDILFQIGNQFAYNPLSDYESFLASTESLITDIQQDDDGLYRINSGYEYSKNDAMLLGYNGMTHYSSTFNASVNSLTSNLGLAQIHFWNSGYGSNPLLDSLFSVKYILAQHPVPKSYILRKDTGVIWEENAGSTASYVNPTALPMVYSAPAVSLNPETDTPDPYRNQNALLNAIAGTQTEYFTEYTCLTQARDTGFSYTFTADSTNPVYLYLDTAEYLPYGPKTVWVNGCAVGGYFTSETLCSLYLGTFSPGQQVVVEIPEQTMAPNAVMIAQLHIDETTRTLNTLQEKGMNITAHSGGHFSGTITLTDGDTILTSIPYDDGWTVKIDGRKVPTEKFADTFLAVRAESGEHTLSFSYLSPGFAAGMLLFLAALLLGSAYFLLPNKTS